MMQTVLQCSSKNVLFDSDPRAKLAMLLAVNIIPADRRNSNAVEAIFQKRRSRMDITDISLSDTNCLPSCD